MSFEVPYARGSTDGNSLYRTGKYSDLEVRCGDLVAKVHKNIVCAQSEWFSCAVEEGRFLVSTS